MHGWDLAAATGGDTRFDPEVVAAIADWFAEREELYRGAGAIGAAERKTGDPQDDLIASFGRDPGWGAEGHLREFGGSDLAAVDSILMSARPSSPASSRTCSRCPSRSSTSAASSTR